MLFAIRNRLLDCEPENAFPHYAQVATPQPLTRGHKKRERTRQILVCSIAPCRTQGGGEIALFEVAAEAAVSNGTLYNYFRTRDEVLEAVGLTMADELSDAISTLSADIHSGAQRLSIGVRMVIRRAADDTNGPMHCCASFILIRPCARD